MPEREKTDKGRTLLHEARQAEGAASHIRRIALVPPDMTIDPNSIKDSITDMMTFFIADPAGAAYASVFTILDTQPLSTDPKMILNGPGQRTIHRAIEVSHTNVELMQLFDAMVAMRDSLKSFVVSHCAEQVKSGFPHNLLSPAHKNQAIFPATNAPGKKISRRSADFTCPWT